MSSVHRKVTFIEDLSLAPTNEAPERYKKALRSLEESDFKSALSGFDDFMSRESASAWFQAAQINAGRSLEGLERWSEAAERYRSVVSATQNKAPKLQAFALYRLSFCQEALGEDQEVVAALNDLDKRKQFLPVEISRAELPARLAGAYARVGNFDQAQINYRIAEEGVAQLRREEGAKVPEWLPRTLYFMGAMPLGRITWDAFEESLRPLPRAQIYLLRASELSVAPWADRASSRLMSIYQELWNTIETAPIPKDDRDPVLAKRETQEKQWERMAILLEHLQALRARAIPHRRGALSEESGEIVQFVAALDTKARAFLTQRPAGEGLTKEALDRKKSVRGSVVNPSSTPDTTLEEKFLKSAEPEKGSGKDPNL